ncbi:MAG: hypothetical protein KDI98_08980 [Hyphomicrobiaceae bacterium]|nr:hypothetical protein [Hyphomicrobiaceae bacterium]
MNSKLTTVLALAVPMLLAPVYGAAPASAEPGAENGYGEGGASNDWTYRQHGRIEVRRGRRGDDRYIYVDPNPGAFWFGRGIYIDNDDYTVRRHRRRYERGDLRFLPGPRHPSMMGD